MAINPNTNATMAGRITAPNSAYPYGSSKDESAPGAGDGTPYFKARADDIFGLQQALLRASGIVPTGNADTALASQYLQALAEQAAGRAINFDEHGTSAADAYVVNIRANQQVIAGLFNDQALKFTTAFAGTGVAATIDVSLLLGQSLGTTIKNIKLPGGTDPAAGDIDGRVELVYDSANGWFEPVSIGVGQATETVAGIAEVATQPETDSGIDDTRIVTPLKLTGAFANLKATTGYQKLPGGLLLQWIKIAKASLSTPDTFGPYSFPIAFPVACLSAHATIDNNSATTGALVPHVDSFSATQVSVYVDNSTIGAATVGFYIFAIGH